MPAPAHHVFIVEDDPPTLGFLFNDKRCTLQDARLVPFLRLAADRARGSLAFLSNYDLGFARSPEVPSRIQKELAEAVPEGFAILQREGATFRLHPLIHVAPIPWAVFERHPHPAIQSIAVAEQKRR